MKNKGVRFITLTAAFLALLIIFQSLSASLGQMVTGSLVNFVLVAATLLAGWKSGLIIALLSPFFAKFFGIGPIYPILPVVALGNATLVGVYAFIMSRSFNSALRWVVSVIVAAALKYAVLTVGVVKLVLPLVSVPAPQAAKLAAMFGTTQFFTAFIGGAVAFIAVPLIQKAVKR
ncbi:MAG: hypothetical protein IJB42_01285 [Oscillospiraceae bacterium]|nr:hypothetical protein [Oscillospiraceae bacterium]MBQ3224318.1 hypothetical protein [Oscillospiraceae bacterium]MBQ4316273.1 hypothetical protein [Oscillospiraceae bacterium]